MEEMEFNGHPFLGLNAYCLERNQKRVFNVDRILEICVAPDDESVKNH
jgi:predicted DNA-binding transcriptional regulator YafY